MRKVNGEAYPMHDNERKQQQQYEYWSARDLENLLQQDGKRDEIESGQQELELEDA